MYYTASRGGLQGVFAIFAHLSGSDKASPFGSNGDDRRQRRKQGVAVGAAASRMRARAKQTLGAATRAVSPQVTERARMLTVIRGRSDSIALTKSLLIAAWAVLSCRACPLRRFAPAPPKGEPFVEEGRPCGISKASPLGRAIEKEKTAKKTLRRKKRLLPDSNRRHPD